MARVAFRSSDLIDFKTFDHKIVIAIDGPAASGKGTLARNIAARFQFSHLDTGMLYRGLGYEVLQSGGNPENEADVKATLENFIAHLSPETLLSPSLRLDGVGSAASKVAVMPFVRTALLDYQRNFAALQPDNIYGVVLDGRDIGTVVCPDADVKVFVTAAPEIRARRRFDELRAKGLDVDYDAVLADIKKRDDRDSNRAIAPLRPAVDSYILDTSQLNAPQALAHVIDVIRAELLEKAG